MNHTPTPYTIEPCTAVNSGGAPLYLNISPSCVDGYRGEICAVYNCAHIGGITYDEMHANAEFIVRACNSHDELVSALSRIMHYANTGASVCDVDTSVQPEFVAAREALAKAGAA